MSNSARLHEAEECEKKAFECLKTSIIKLKFKPDFDGAATAMERASVCYRNSGNLSKAAESLQNAGNYHNQNGNLFHAAKAREGAAMLLRDVGDCNAAFILFEQAINGYSEAGSLDTAALSVDKAAQVVLLSNPEKAIELYEKGLALVQQDDRSKLARLFLSQITRINLRLAKYKEAVRAIKNEIDKYVEDKETLRLGQLAIGIVLVHLALGDSIAAAKHFEEILQLCPDIDETDDGRACYQLIQSWEEGNDINFQAVLKSGPLRSMDNEYLRLMKNIHASFLGVPHNTEEMDENDLK